MRSSHPNIKKITTSKIPNGYRIESWQVHDKESATGLDKYERGAPATCARFGCGKTLTLTEQLCGKYCIGCSGVQKLDITKVIKFK